MTSVPMGPGARRARNREATGKALELFSEHAERGSSSVSSPEADNATIRELSSELLKYQRAIQQSGDKFDRGHNTGELKRVLEEQEFRAAHLFRTNKAPPRIVIVDRETARAAGLNVAVAEPICDRNLQWRMVGSLSWNQRAVNQNAAACARDDNRITTGIRVPQPWLVSRPADLAKLAGHMRGSSRWIKPPR